jgi:hypothetical protein
VQAHDLADGIMQDEVDKIERDDSRESLGEVLKQLVQIPVHSDGLRNPEQSVILSIKETLRLRREYLPIHSFKHIQRLETRSRRFLLRAHHPEG